jgi:transketolase
MVGTAVGFSRLGFKPFVSTFAAFLTRAYDQIRMAALSGAEIRFCGSHAGVSIGEDGPSQMGLEDISMFRSIQGSTVLYPSDAVSTAKLVAQMVDLKGISYLRASRPNTSVIYKADEEFPIGGCKVHMNKSEIRNPKSEIIIITAGVTLFEVLKAQEELAKEGIEVTVVDLYSVKPIDSKTLFSLVQPPTTNHQPITNIITVEDHWFDGGLGDAVLNVFSNHRLSTINHQLNIHKLAVNLMPRSGKPAELLNLEGIDSAGIIKKAKEILQLIP